MASSIVRLARLRRLLLGSAAACATLYNGRDGLIARAKSYKAAPGGKGELITLNAEFNEKVSVSTEKMDWVASPIPNVERKRVFLHGTKEAGRVTSVVRYAPGSRFHEHPHPEGEEFLVLEGIFSDHSGDYGPGTYCLNPEGFKHAPWSKPGCEIIVRLRQHPNLDSEGRLLSWFSGAKPRGHVVIKPEEGSWISEPSWGSSVTKKVLYQEQGKGYEDSTWLEKISAGSTRSRQVPKGMIEEVFVVEGNVTAFGSKHSKGTWIRHPEGEATVQTNQEDVIMYVRQAPVDMIAPPLK